MIGYRFIKQKNLKYCVTLNNEKDKVKFFQDCVFECSNLISAEKNNITMTSDFNIC